MTKEDVFEFFCAGADFVQIGTLNFIDLESINKMLSWIKESYEQSIVFKWKKFF